MKIEKLTVVFAVPMFFAAALAREAPTDIYLLIGQSNMAGRGATNAANRISPERVFKFTRDGKWTEGVEPIHFDRPNVGAGPGLAFGRAMADAKPTVEIGLVPCAVGGSPLSRWEPGGDLYSNAVERTRAALATGGSLRGILWHQGEADSWKRGNAESYARRLTHMVTQLRADLGVKYVPFIAGEVGAHYGASIEKRGGKSFVDEVNRQMKSAVAKLPAAGWVSVKGLGPGPDGIHFTTESSYELGRRYAREILRWQSIPCQMPEDEDYGGNAADWRPPFTAHGFNLQGMRRSGPKAGFREDHFKWIKEWGFNFVRLPLDYRCWVKDRKSGNREIIDEEGLKLLDKGIAFARKHGLVTMICLHRIPGEYCVPQVDPEPGNIYTDPDCLRAAVMHWKLLAQRYRDIPREALFFNLINEPSSRLGTIEQYEYVARVLVASIRKVDSKRFIVADGWQGGNVPVPGLYGIPGVGQAARGYYPYWFSHFGVDVAASLGNDKVSAPPPTWPPRRGCPDGRLGGPKWPDWHEPFAIANAPAAKYALVLGEVSGSVLIEVAADGERVASFRLEPQKGNPEWSKVSRYRGTGPWRGIPARPLTFTLPKRAERLSIQLVEGDWAMPSSLVLKNADGREARIEFGQNMKTMKSTCWRRRFAGWNAREPLPLPDGVSVPSGRFADEGMNVMCKGWLDRWEDPIANGVWCLAGEFGCANHTAHMDSLRFLESGLNLFEVLGMGWCSWGFIGSRFGILDSGRCDVEYEDWKGRKLDRKMLELLRRHAAKGVALDSVPEVVTGSEPELARFAKTAWAMAYDHVTNCVGAVQSPYMDEAFSPDRTWIWDTCFMALFCRYAPDVFPGVESLMNFYAPMLDGTPSALKVHIPDNPPLFAWAEWMNYRMTGDRKRIDLIFGGRKYPQRMFDLYERMKIGDGFPFQSSAFPVLWEKRPLGYLWTGGRSGMDNTPRGGFSRQVFDNDARYFSILWIDAISQQALACRIIYEATGDEVFKKRFDEYAGIINERYWDDEDGAYYDISASPPHKTVKVLTPASFWPLLAGVVPPERARRLVAHLKNPRKLGGDVPFPSVSRDSRFFNPKGEYWRGGVWLPTVYMCVRALEENGFADLADELAEKTVRHQFKTYKAYSPHTIWEAYSPTEAKPASCKVNIRDEVVRPDFCGWSALGPISMMIENVVGINADGVKREVEWRLRRTDRHGVRNLRFGGVTASLVFENGQIEIESSAPFLLRVKGVVHKVPVGRTTLPVGGVERLATDK